LGIKVFERIEHSMGIKLSLKDKDIRKKIVKFLNNKRNNK